MATWRSGYIHTPHQRTSEFVQAQNRVQGRRHVQFPMVCRGRCEQIRVLQVDGDVLVGHRGGTELPADWLRVNAGSVGLEYYIVGIITGERRSGIGWGD